MARPAYLTILHVRLTFGEVPDAPQRSLRSQTGLRPEPKRDLNHRVHRGHRGKKEQSSSDSLSVPSEFSVVKYFPCAEGTRLYLDKVAVDASSFFHL